MEFFIAILPILVIFIFLFVFKFTLLRSGIITYFITILFTIIFSNYSLPASQIIHSSFHGFLIAFIAAYVLFFGILLFYLLDQVGGIKAIASFISTTTNDRILQVIILVIGFSPLVESTSGFGIAFMMVAPIFIALGFSPMQSAMLGLISLLAVPWGALSTGSVIASELGGVSLQSIGVGTAIISVPVFAYFLFVATYIAGGFHGVKNKWKELFILLFTFSASLILFNAYVSVELAGALSSLVTMVVGIGIGKLLSKNSNTTDSAKLQTEQQVNIPILKAMSPYIMLTFLIYISRMWLPAKSFLESYVVIEVPRYSFSMPLLYSPGFWVFITCLFTIVLFKIKKETVLLSIKKTFKQWIPFTITTTAFVCISEIMSEAGMISTIASTAGNFVGSGFLYISPLIGAMGGFLTGSNAGSNAMFIKLQVQTAKEVGLSAEAIACMQNAGSSHSTMASPSRVMLGSSLCGVQSEENVLLKRMAFIVLGSLLLIICTMIGLSFFYEF